MISVVTADIIPVLENVVKALKPYAGVYELKLGFRPASKKQVLQYDPKVLIDLLSGLLCKLINYTPAHNLIEVVTREENLHFIIQVHNTGIDLSRVNEITCHAKTCVEVAANENGTIFQYRIPFIAEDKEQPAKEVVRSPSNNWVSYYANIRKRLRSHFSKADNLVALLSDQHPKDAAFLQRINLLIRAHLDDESFDTAALCRAMAMSRTQLFRKLKPLIRQAPAHYIRTMRLEKAKELLETSDLNIAEVTFKTGFQSQSHFTKVFTQHYGVAPSLFRRRR